MRTAAAPDNLRGLRGTLLRIVLVVVAVLLVHLPAHWAPWSDAPLREPLPEDSPAFVGNAALAPAGTPTLDAVARAAFDPAAAWSGGADTVGAVRWRPLATVLLAAERAAPWADGDRGAVVGAALVSLLFHLLTALAAVKLAEALGARGNTPLLAGLAVAVAPSALAAAAWPARQSVALAACLAVHGALLALRTRTPRPWLGAVLLAAAGLAHEGAFAWALAVPVLAMAPDDDESPRRFPWAAVVLPLAAFAWRTAHLGGLGAADGDRPAGAPNAIDGLTGVARAVLAFVVPVGTHFADGPFTYPFVAHAAAVVGLAAAVALLWRRRRERAASAFLACLVALSAVPLALLGGVGIAPYQDGYLYLALPLLACTFGLVVSTVGARGIAHSAIAGAVAIAMLAAAAVSTAMRASSFRTRAAFIAMAKDAMPSSVVVRTWDISSRAGGQKDALVAVAPEVNDLAASVSGDAGARLARDAVATAIVARFLGDYMDRVRVSPLAAHEFAFEAADAAGTAVTGLVPRSGAAWWRLAKFRWKTGAMRGAREAVEQGLAAAPGDPSLVQLAAETALVLGDARFAADLLEREHERLRADPEVKTIPVEFLLLYAKALAADGALRVPDPLRDRGVRYRFDLAADVLETVTQDIPEQRAPTSPGKNLLYDVYLRYGDLLASTDRTVLALSAYDRAVALTGGKPDSLAAEHRRWLTDRLAAEQKKAEDAVVAAQAEAGQANLANAMVALYVAMCRFGPEPRGPDGDMRKSADALFAQIERDLRGIPPELRYYRAVERYAVLANEENQSLAERELTIVLEARPSLARARFERAKVIEWQGTIEALGKARDEYEAAANAGAFEDWSLDALERAELISEYLVESAR